MFRFKKIFILVFALVLAVMFSNLYLSASDDMDQIHDEIEINNWIGMEFKQWLMIPYA